MGRDDLAGDAVARAQRRAAPRGRRGWTARSRRWTSTRSPDDVLAAMARADVPASSIYTVRDIVADAHYRARDMIREIRDAGRRRQR